jgi:hypothetical protein
MDLSFGNEVYEKYHKCNLSKSFRSHIPGNLIWILWVSVRLSHRNKGIKVYLRDHRYSKFNSSLIDRSIFSVTFVRKEKFINEMDGNRVAG